jgi:crotonobetainyl-CoA:carnitine CoA-transferase CaiB-like acyl-CoA transferase
MRLVIDITSTSTAPAMGGGATCGGPLAGLRIVELAAIGPVPHAAMILADLGAEVVRAARPSRDQEGRKKGQCSSGDP